MILQILLPAWNVAQNPYTTVELASVYLLGWPWGNISLGSYFQVGNPSKGILSLGSLLLN